MHVENTKSMLFICLDTEGHIGGGRMDFASFCRCLHTAKSQLYMLYNLQKGRRVGGGDTLLLSNAESTLVFPKEYILARPSQLLTFPFNRKPYFVENPTKKKEKEPFSVARKSFAFNGKQIKDFTPHSSLGS